MARGARSRWGWGARAVASVVVLFAVGWGGLAWASATRADLDDAEGGVDAAWRVLRPTLDQRYGFLADLTEALAPAVGEGTDPIPAVTAELGTWGQLADRRASADGPQLVEAEVASATRLEGLAHRLVLIAGTTDRLRADPLVVATAAAVASVPIVVPAAAYNRAVADYAEERAAFPARALVGVFDHEPRHPLTLPPEPAVTAVAPDTATADTATPDTAAPPPGDDPAAAAPPPG